jgi:hypothetical protein
MSVPDDPVRQEARLDRLRGEPLARRATADPLPDPNSGEPPDLGDGYANRLVEAAEASTPKPAKKSQATRIIELSEVARYVYDEAGYVYAVIERAGHREVWPVRSRAYRAWLAARYYTLRPDRDAALRPWLTRSRP